MTRDYIGRHRPGSVVRHPDGDLTVYGVRLQRWQVPEGSRFGAVTFAGCREFMYVATVPLSSAESTRIARRLAAVLVSEKGGPP